MNILQIHEIKQVADQVIEGLIGTGLEPVVLRAIREKELFAFELNEAGEVEVFVVGKSRMRVCSFARPDCLDGPEAVGFLELIMYSEIDKL